MIMYETDGVIFVQRVAAVIVDGSRVLLHRIAADDFWSLPGGKAELMETSVETIRREMREELNAEVNVERLLWVVESFFRYQDQSHHEMGLYFLCSLPVDSPLRTMSEPFTRLECNRPGKPLQFTFQWFLRSKATLEEIRLLPEFLRLGLVDLPAETKLVINQITKI